ncbi:MAG: ECF transporter S component [Cetobacterium sp.]|uniref:ECF transporter S component n=1 Tax=unclassified Cetobacterium TaxID=2630983 RepID=UPI00163C0471|nr:ECF transporter S component [Cetobacterium sp. 2A]MBC2856877.1 ECF transporter S component [Cetobacterium sp. 2A]
MKKNLELLAILLIPVAIAVNAVGFQIAQLLRLPVYLDAIGTILIGAIAGPVAGLIAGLLTNFINGIFNPVYLPYSILSGILGITAGVLSHYNCFKTIKGTIFAGVVLSLVSTVIAAPITVIVFGGVTGSTMSAATAVLLASGQKIWGAVFSTQLVSEIADKMISVFIVHSLIKKMSSRYLSKLEYGSKYL